MGRYINLGNASFASVRKGLYIDKSEMISFINSTLGTIDKLTCVSRPRRFGKSLAAKMLCAYYDKSCDSATGSDQRIKGSFSERNGGKPFFVPCFERYQ